MASSKLEMSLDDIIKQTKKTERSQKKVGGSIIKGSQKKASIGLANKNKRIGRQRLTGVGKGKQLNKNKPFGNQRRKVIGGVNNKRRNGPGNGIKNKALTTVATTNLVKKLVKKALTQTNTLRPVRGIRGKILRSRGGNARMLGRSPAINRVTQRSRVIGRRQRIIAPIPMAAIQMGPKIRGRGPIRYVPVMETIPAVRRIRYVPQRVANNYGGMMGQVVRNRGPIRRAPQQQQQRFSTIREQINALRQGAARTQVRQQQFMVVQQQPRTRVIQPRMMIPAQQIRQRQPRQRQNQQQFVRQRKQVQISPFYEPPNYLQRIPTQQTINNSNRRFAGNF